MGATDWEFWVWIIAVMLVIFVLGIVLYRKLTKTGQAKVMEYLLRLITIVEQEYGHGKGQEKKQAVIDRFYYSFDIYLSLTKFRFLIPIYKKFVTVKVLDSLIDHAVLGLKHFFEERKAALSIIEAAKERAKNTTVIGVINDTEK